MARRRTAILAVTLCMLTSACTQASDTTVPMTTRPTPDQNVPPYSQVWSAEPGIDLFGRGAELVRASLEAGQYAALYSIGTTFPGYLESFGDRRRIDGSEIWTDLVPNGSGNGAPARGPLATTSPISPRPPPKSPRKYATTRTKPHRSPDRNNRGSASHGW